MSTNLLGFTPFSGAALFPSPVYLHPDAIRKIVLLVNSHTLNAHWSQPYIHPASRGVAAHTASLFRSVRGAKGGFPPWGLPKLRIFTFPPPWGLPKLGNFHFSLAWGLPKLGNFHFSPPWGLPKLGNFHFSLPWGLPKLGNFHFSPPWGLPKLGNFHFSPP